MLWELIVAKRKVSETNILINFNQNLQKGEQFPQI